MVDKTILLSHPRYHQKNLIEFIKVLLNNSYPLPFIFNTIRSRLTLHSKKEFLTIFKDTDYNQDHAKEYFTIPYINSISESFIPITNKFGFNIAFSIPNTLDRFIKCGKDNLDPMSQQCVVYKIFCRDCESSYVGQTKRQLRTRIKEHISDIRKKSGSPSVISEHRLEHNHDFDWSNVKIIDNEHSYQKRLISEMVHIKKQAHGINKQSDTDLLPISYLPVLDLIPPSWFFIPPFHPYCSPSSLSQSLTVSSVAFLSCSYVRLIISYPVLRTATHVRYKLSLSLQQIVLFN